VRERERDLKDSTASRNSALIHAYRYRCGYMYLRKYVYIYIYILYIISACTGVSGSRLGRINKFVYKVNPFVFCIQGLSTAASQRADTLKSSPLDP
jgi:hypothetical protein